MPTPPSQENNRHAPPQFVTRSLTQLFLFFLKFAISVLFICLFLFFLGIAAAVLLHLHFMSKAFNRRCTRLFHPARVTADIEALLPGLSYVAADFPERSDCAICLDCFREGDGCRNMPICKHLFHAKCVDGWIGKNPTCPVCRAPVDLGRTAVEEAADG